ncbi:MAG: DUF7901 domain-containing protein, partial [Planctomycetota bacterium]
FRWWGSFRDWNDVNLPEDLPDAFYLTLWIDVPAGEPCEPEPQIKWVQWPDLNDDGMDVDASYCQIIGDDFQCSQSGPITDIHIWASWRLDEAPDGDANLVDFKLSIYSDDPCGINGYSEPNELLWTGNFASGEFDVSLYAWNLSEGWYSPCSDVYDSFSDTECWQYDFYIDPCSAFIQQGDTTNPATYWLVVEATPHDENAYFGVKTRDYYDGHYKDDAVWSLPDDEDWQELRYPRGHQFFDESIDLAFAITTANEPEQTYSHPDQITWQYWFYSYDVNFYGWEYDPRSGETELAKFEFYAEVDLPLDWWYQLSNNEIYWLGIRAIYSDVTEEPNYPWGWQTRPHFFMDDAVRFFSEPQLGVQYPAEDFEPIEFDSNSWDLSFELIGMPPGNDCDDPVLVTLGPDDLPYVNTNFTCARDNDYNDTCLGYFDEGEDIIYELNVTEAMDVNVTLDPGVTINTGIALDDSCPPDNPCMKFSTSTLAEPHGFCVHLEPGTYYIMVDTWPAPFCMSDFTLTIDDGGPSPANDDCNNAELVGDVVDLPFDTTCASFDGNGICMYSPNIWYCYTATCTGLVTVSLCGSSYDTMLAVYNGCDCYPASSDLIECNDDHDCNGAFSWQSQITFHAAAGSDYLIEVGGYGTNTGQGLLSISCCPAPANDDCNDAEPVSDVADLPFDTTCATTDGSSPCVLGANIWYCYTATCTGDVTVSLCGSSFDTMLAVYDDCNCYPGAGDMIACNDDFPCPDGNLYRSEANFPAIAGNDYLIEVGGFGSSTGPGLLSIWCEESAKNKRLKWSQPPIEIDPNLAETPVYCGWDERSYLVASTSGLVYENVDACGLGRNEKPGDSGYLPIMADDMNLASSERELVHYDFAVSASAGTAPYTVTSELYTNNLGLPGMPIAGTLWNHNVALDGYGVLGYYAAGPAVILPDTLCMVLSFSDVNVGWQVGENAELGFTSYMFGLDDGTGWGLYYFGDGTYGGFEASISCESEEKEGIMVADDYRCLGTMPVTSIHWWGSYIGWQDSLPPPQQPNGWWISFWTNVPANPQAEPNYSRPEELLWQVKVPAGRVEWEWAGSDWFPELGGEACFQYYLQLEPEEYFWQGDFEPNTIDNVFWLSIAAIYDPWNEDPCNPWGWKTRPWHWMDDAVRFELDGVLEPPLTLDPRVHNITPIEDPVYHESADMAFELDTDPNYVKWDQPFTGIRRWPHYEDELSMAKVEPVIEFKWRQEPDLSDYNSIDVDASKDERWQPQLLADDFLCDMTGPITDIHVWGSWYGDHYPYNDVNNVAFTLSIHDDLPVGDPCNPYSYSIPGQLLWTGQFQPSEFEVLPYAWSLDEGWYVPCAEPPYYEPSADTVCWEYTFSIDPCDAFIQEEGEIYWLDVQARPVPEPFAPVPFRFGWKTTTSPWNDEAVWAIGTEPNHGQWNNLRYPYGHPDAGATADLAFAITTYGAFKREQLPDLDNTGIDVDATDEQKWQPQVLADDFECTTSDPITDIHIWGSWYGDFMPSGGDETAVSFTLSIHKDIPADPNIPDSYSMPGDLLWTRDFQPGQFWVSPYAVGLTEGWYVPCADPPYYEPDAESRCWQYDFYMNPVQAFHQQGDPCNPVTYWLDVQASPVFSPSLPLPITRFGWKTSIDHWNDDAVWAVGEDPPAGPWNELRYPPGHPFEGQTADLAFAITTEKQELILQALVADDWQCDQNTPVTAAVWWGSYIDYNYEACEGLPIELPVKPDYFKLTIWDDVPDPNPADAMTYSHPNDMIWDYNAYDYDEVLVGYDKHPEGPTILGHEPVFRYSVRLPREAWFFQEDVNDIYWFSVVAVYDQNVPNYDWGWTNHRHEFNDDAVTGVLDVSGDEPNWVWEKLYDQTGASEDMSFVLFTDPDPNLGTCWDPLECAGQTCGDATCDGQVNLDDLAALKAAWGMSSVYANPY